MLRNGRLYKDTKGQVWHVKSDGTAVKYPQFEVYAKIPKGTYEEMPYEEQGIDVSDKLYLAKQYFSNHLCVIPQHEEDFGCTYNAFGVLSGEWIHLYGIDWILFDVVNLEKGAKYVVEKKEDDVFVFRNDTSAALFLRYFALQIYQIKDIKEVSNTKKVQS